MLDVGISPHLSSQELPKTGGFTAGAAKSFAKTAQLVSDTEPCPILAPKQCSCSGPGAQAVQSRIHWVSASPRFGPGQNADPRLGSVAPRGSAAGRGYRVSSRAVGQLRPLRQGPHPAVGWVLPQVKSCLSLARSVSFCSLITDGFLIPR